ncbi:enoyl-CoA hydratase/isomerase family protein [Paraburkholderia sp. D1E]|uniref:enoyl-CoA hydratase/isomerase family protein n=1 Tax=Paraburkholderia sp. D1E TaxID=3461398 RepID=UPI00404594A5
MKSIRFERTDNIGSIVLANPPYNRLDVRFANCLEEAVREASEGDIRVLVVRAEGPNFSLGGEVREWPGRDANWFRTFVAKVNSSYRAIEALRVPTVAIVQGAAFGGGFELALSCDFIVTADDSIFRCVEVTTAMLPLAGALQRLAERVGRGRASRFVMLGEPISGTQAAKLGIATHVASMDSLSRVAGELISKLVNGPTMSFATTRTLLKAWSSGGAAGADSSMLDICIDLYGSDDATRGFLNTAAAFDIDAVPPDISFHGK